VAPRRTNGARSPFSADDADAINTLSLYSILTKAYAWLGNARQSAAYFERHDSLQASWLNQHYQSAIRDN
jgi:hypothetical protein